MCHSRENGNPDQLDPQSEALRFRLRMTPGLLFEDDKGGFRLRITRGLSVEDDKGAFG